MLLMAFYAPKQASLAVLPSVIEIGLHIKAQVCGSKYQADCSFSVASDACIIALSQAVTETPFGISGYWRQLQGAERSRCAVSCCICLAIHSGVSFVD